MAAPPIDNRHTDVSEEHALKARLRKWWELFKLVPHMVIALVTLDAEELEDIESEVRRINRSMP